MPDSSNDKSLEIAKEKRKQRAKERLSSLSGGDITRGLGGSMKQNASDTYSTQKAKAKVQQKQKAGTKTTESKTGSKTTSRKTAERKTKSTAINSDVFSDDILLENKKSRRKKQVGSLVLDEGALETIATVSAEKRSKRNVLLISFLIVAIVLCWTFVLFAVIIKPQKPKYNCYSHLNGNATSGCELTMNGQKISKWLSPLSPKSNGLMAGNIYNIEMKLNIDKTEPVNVRFRVEVLNKGQIVENAVSIQTMAEFVLTQDNSTEWYVYENVTTPNELIILESLTFMNYRDNQLLMTLTDTNMEINFYVEVYI